VREFDSLRVGCVKYLNARPLIRGWPGPVTFDHPAALSDQLQRGLLQVALVSSLELLRHPIYRIVDGVSIASDGAVYSVVVAHRSEISVLEEIVLDPASLTSVALLRCLLEAMNFFPRLVSSDMPKTPEGRRGLLLIGDQAIRFRQENAQKFRYWDLGEQWKKITGLPFVYAVWLVRPEVSETESIVDQIRSVRDRNLGEIEKLVTDEQEFDREFCRRYFLEYLRFSFAEKEKKGLHAFAALCAKHDLIPKRDVALNFV
jgi:chorismate dehydratase